MRILLIFTILILLSSCSDSNHINQTAEKQKIEEETNKRVAANVEKDVYSNHNEKNEEITKENSINEENENLAIENGEKTNKENRENVDTKEDTNDQRIITKEITIKAEGTEQVEVFKKVDDESLPFTTYIPIKWSVELSDQKASFIWEDKGYIDVVFLTDELNETDIKKMMDDILQNYPQHEERTDKYASSTVISAYVMKGQTKERNWLYGGLILLKDNDRRFYIHSHLNSLEYGDVFIPIQNTIFDEWKWKESKEGLSLQ